MRALGRTIAELRAADLRRQVTKTLALRQVVLEAASGFDDPKAALEIGIPRARDEG